MQMTNEQLYLAIAVPIFFNGIIAVILSTMFNARLTDLRADVGRRLDDMRAEFRELLAAERRAWDASFKHVLDKLDDLHAEAHRK